MHSSPTRLCACGCGRAIPPNASAKRIWATGACLQRGPRARTRRGQLDLAELLDVAQREARARPGSVVLRVAGRLVVLNADDLAQFAAGLAGAALAPPKDEHWRPVPLTPDEHWRPAPLTPDALVPWLRDLSPDALTCPPDLVETIQAALAAAELDEAEGWIHELPVSANDEADPWIRLYLGGVLVHCGSCSEWVATG